LPLCAVLLPVQGTALAPSGDAFSAPRGLSNLIRFPVQTQRRVKRMGFQALCHQPLAKPRRHQNPRQNPLRAGSGVHPGHQGGTLAGMIHRKGFDNPFLHAPPRQLPAPLRECPSRPHPPPARKGSVDAVLTHPESMLRMVGAATALRQAPVPTPAAGANAVNTEHRKGGTLGTTGTDQDHRVPRATALAPGSRQRCVEAGQLTRFCLVLLGSVSSIQRAEPQEEYLRP